MTTRTALSLGMPREASDQGGPNKERCRGKLGLRALFRPPLKPTMEAKSVCSGSKAASPVRVASQLRVPLSPDAPSAKLPALERRDDMHNAGVRNLWRKFLTCVGVTLVASQIQSLV